MKTISFDIDPDGVALLTIDLRHRPVNVLTPEFTAELADCIETIAGDAAIRAAVITSGKAGSFIAGADIKDMVLAFDRGFTAIEAAEMSQNLSRILRRLETCGKPIACAINGLALGGGFEVALACHYRVLADDARVGLPEVNLGLLPGAGGTQRLPRLIGIEKAATLLLSGAPVKGAVALEMGLVHAVTRYDLVVAAAKAWLIKTPRAIQPWDDADYRIPGSAAITENAVPSFSASAHLIAESTQPNYPAPLAILSCLHEGTQVSIDKGLSIESHYFGQLLSGPVARNMMRTLFINKGEAEKLSRRPLGVPKSAVRKLGVLGAGLMGAGIAHISAAAGIEVVLLDTTEEQASRGKAYSVRVLQKKSDKGEISRERFDALLARIQPTTRFEDLTGCDLVIEAVYEDRVIKADVTRKAGAAIAETTIFASNTSTLPITGLASAFPRPANFIGLHFFSPVESMPLLEVIMGEGTSQTTLAKALDYAAQIRMTPILVNDSPGFFTSRVISTFAEEGMLMLLEGISPASIERAAQQAGFPVGPLQLGDEVSLALQLGILEQRLADGLPNQPHQSAVLDLLRKMVRELKRAGRRAGAGYYEYPADGDRKLWPGLAELYPVAAVQPELEEVGKRFLYIQALESARCLEEGVIMHAADADIGSVIGTGFPSWTGGTLSYIDTVGLQTFVDECERRAATYGPRFRPSDWLKAKATKAEGFHPPMSSLA